MKICWDSLEKLRYIKRTGNFKYNLTTYHYADKCLGCGEPFLNQNKNGKFCSIRCSKLDIKRPYISEKMKGDNNPAKKIEVREKLSRAQKTKIGNLNQNWKDNITHRNVPLYNTYAHQLEPYEQCRRNEQDLNILEIKCTYCGKWYMPTMISVNNRISGISSTDLGRFYCSDGCKIECPIYGRHKYYKGQQGYSSREVQPQLRQMAFARDEYVCIKCGSDGPLHCHHIDPVANNPIESADVDNCVTLCVECHKEAHKLPGCGYAELKNCSNY